MPTVLETFYKRVKEVIEMFGDITNKEIFKMFPEVNEKTINWRLFNLVQTKKLTRNEYGTYTLTKRVNQFELFEYFSTKSKKIYDVLSDYSYDFYISGIDGLISDMLHMPEAYPTVVVTTLENEYEILNTLDELGFNVISERQINRSTVKSDYMYMVSKKADVYILVNKNLELSVDGIAQKEKAIVDLYYLITRYEFMFSRQEFVRLFNSLNRKNSISTTMMRKAAKQAKVSTEIDIIVNRQKIPRNAKRSILDFLNEGDFYGEL